MFPCLLTFTVTCTKKQILTFDDFCPCYEERSGNPAQMEIKDLLLCPLYLSGQSNYLHAGVQEQNLISCLSPYGMFCLKIITSPHYYYGDTTIKYPTLSLVTLQVSLGRHVKV